MTPDTSAQEYDMVIIGSGLGGLVCAYILSMEGYKVAVLEKNHQIGGMLQVFSRDKAILDTGVHYIGSMNPSENVHQLFRYLGILEHLKIQALNPEGFDVIRFDDGTSYPMPQGYENFQKWLTGLFPDEAGAIQAYCQKLQEICLNFPLYNLEAGAPDYLSNQELLTLKTYDYIAGLTSNRRLQQVLAGCNSFLYAGKRETTPFYVHALIMNSYLNGAVRLVDGGSQIAILLSRQIRRHGGLILKHKLVTGGQFDADGRLTGVVLSDGAVVAGKHFISNLHPVQTVAIFGEDRFLKMYRRRIGSLENSISSFTVHLVFKPRTFPYLDHNIYQYHTDDVWAGLQYDPANWPEQYFISTPATSKNPEYAESMSVMTFMRFEEVAPWADTHHTVARPGDRGTAYSQFKKRKEEQVLTRLETVFPGIRSQIQSVHSSTPLTFRDYTGSPEGSMYGILKSADNPLRTLIGTRTHIPNLHLTGQNVFMHGILGVILGAVATCFSFIDKDDLIDRIRHS